MYIEYEYTLPFIQPALSRATEGDSTRYSRHFRHFAFLFCRIAGSLGMPGSIHGGSSSICIKVKLLLHFKEHRRLKPHGRAPPAQQRSQCISAQLVEYCKACFRLSVVGDERKKGASERRTKLGIQLLRAWKRQSTARYRRGHGFQFYSGLIFFFRL